MFLNKEIIDTRRDKYLNFLKCLGKMQISPEITEMLEWILWTREDDSIKMDTISIVSAKRIEKI